VWRPWVGKGHVASPTVCKTAAKALGVRLPPGPPACQTYSNRLCLQPRNFQRAGSAADCPQSVAAFYASNFVWHPTVDPTQSANVAWDDIHGFFTVKGSYDYDSMPP